MSKYRMLFRTSDGYVLSPKEQGATVFYVDEDLTFRSVPTHAGYPWPIDDFDMFVSGSFGYRNESGEWVNVQYGFMTEDGYFFQASVDDDCGEAEYEHVWTNYSLYDDPIPGTLEMVLDSIGLTREDVTLGFMEEGVFKPFAA